MVTSASRGAYTKSVPPTKTEARPASSAFSPSHPTTQDPASGSTSTSVEPVEKVSSAFSPSSTTLSPVIAQPADSE